MKRIIVILLVFLALTTIVPPHLEKVEEVKEEIYLERIPTEHKSIPVRLDEYDKQKALESKAYRDLYWKVYNTAAKLLGTKGDCYSVVKKFVMLYYGVDLSVSNLVLTKDPQPGVIIYYKDGSLGLQHWAVYIGDELALHGNYNGTTIFHSIYLKGGTAPIFYKLI